MPTTTRWPRASSPLSNESSSTFTRGRAVRKRGVRSPSTSRVSTKPDADTPRSDTSVPQGTRKIEWEEVLQLKGKQSVETRQTQFQCRCHPSTQAQLPQGKLVQTLEEVVSLHPPD